MAFIALDVAAVPLVVALRAAHMARGAAVAAVVAVRAAAPWWRSPLFLSKARVTWHIRVRTI